MNVPAQFVCDNCHRRFDVVTPYGQYTLYGGSDTCDPVEQDNGDEWCYYCSGEE